MTANEFTTVKDIKGNFLYTTDDYIIGYLRIFPYNLDLLTKEEKRVKTQNLSSSFDGDRKDFTYFTFPRELDLDEYKSFLKEQYQEELQSPGRRKILELMILEAVKLSSIGENFEHQHFIKLWMQAGNNLNDSKHELYARLEEFRERYKMVGVESTILGETEIIKLCNLFGNSLHAASEQVDPSTLYAAIPQFR